MDTHLLLWGTAIGIALFGALIAIWLSRITKWRSSGPLALLVAAPLVPHLPLVSVLSLDDVLPLMAVVMLTLSLPWQRASALRRRFVLLIPLLRFPWVLVTVGLGTMATAGALSAIAHADSVPELLALLGRGAGRPIVLGAVLVLILLTRLDRRRRFIAAVALAVVGTAEALFGLVAFFLPLPDLAGLEPARRYSVLYGTVPGRVAGTTGLSPDFLGAILVATTLLSIGLAMDTKRRLDALLWWGVAAAQLAALLLTFTRAAIALFVIATVVLLVRQGRAALAAFGIGLIVIVASQSAVGDRFLRETTDRLALWTSAVTMMMDHPLFGVGPGQMAEAALEQPGRYRETPAGTALSNAHNAVLLAGAETGFVGAFGAAMVLTGLGFGSLLVLRRHASRDAPVADAAALAALCFAGQAMTNNLLTVAVTSVLATVLVATFLIGCCRRWPEKADRGRRGGRSATSRV